MLILAVMFMDISTSHYKKGALKRVPFFISKKYLNFKRFFQNTLKI